MPDWDAAARDKLSAILRQMTSFVATSRGMFGDVDAVDKVAHLVGTAGGWACSLNNVTAKPGPDGKVAIRFGGDPRFPALASLPPRCPRERVIGIALSGRMFDPHHDADGAAV